MQVQSILNGTRITRALCTSKSDGVVANNSVRHVN
jgi:hypothetical protein